MQHMTAQDEESLAALLAPPALSAHEKQELARRRAKAELLLLEWTEKLLDTVTAQDLTRAATYMRPADYQEVVVERNLVKLCGYPMCGAACEAKRGTGMAFRVSQNQVVDRDSEARFCSKLHERASDLYAAQLSPEPLWYRKELDTEESETSYSRAVELYSGT